MTHLMIIAIDGPAGAGKGTISRIVAQHFSLKHIDTGLFYRALAYKAICEKIEMIDESALIALSQFLTLDDLQLSTLREEHVGNAASKIAIMPAIRTQITKHIRQFSQKITSPYKGVVLDGRDIGTVVYPDAKLKIFVTASPKVRAERRSKEIGKADASTQQEILKQILERDQRDQTRTTSPLHPANDAVLLDTSSLTIQDACQQAINIIETHPGFNKEFQSNYKTLSYKL